jgi:hypothetical protein
LLRGSYQQTPAVGIQRHLPPEGASPGPGV